MFYNFSKIGYQSKYVPNLTSDFGFEGFNFRRYNWLFLDEFNISDTDEDRWKILVAGEEIQINRKGRPAFNHSFNIPIAMSSNHEPPSFKGFNERVEVIRADKGEFYQTLALQQFFFYSEFFFYF